MPLPLGMVGASRNVAAGGGDPTFGALGTIGSSGGTGVNTISSTLANVAAGDLVLAFIQRDYQQHVTSMTMAGTSMTLLKAATDGSAQEFFFDVWGIIAPSNVASATITASYSTTASWATIITARWSGVASATPLTSSCNTAGCSGLATSSTDRLAQSITTSERALVIAAGCDWNDYRTHTSATGWTKRADGSGTPVTSLQFIHDRVSDAGTYGGATAFATTSAADQYLSILLAFA